MFRSKSGRASFSVGARVRLPPTHHVGVVRYVENKCACVKWDDMDKIYTYEFSQLVRDHSARENGK